MFLRLGLTAFGGPAAHIGLFHHETVIRRKWIDEQGFLDLLGAVNLIPGPNSTEMAIHLGYRRAGWPGLIVAGSTFILPAAVLVTGLAWFYTRFGQSPELGWLLYGVKPVVIVIVLQALWKLSRTALRSAQTAVAGLLALGMYFLGVSPLLALLAGGAVVLGTAALARLRPALLAPLASLALQPASAASQPFSLAVLFWTFLKTGAVLYGSGYVLLAFLQADLVDRLGWITNPQLLEAIAIGQVTPGPVFTTATFIGYLLGGLPGAILATVGIFLPSFVFVALSNRLIPRLRSSPWAGRILDGVNAASLGLMAAVAWELGRDAIVDPLTLAIALGAAFLLFRRNVNTTWLILGGASAGLVSSWLR